MKIIEADFKSRGLRCAGRLYLPAKSARARPPVVILAHGFGAEMAFGLENYAREFIARGMAAFLFDYRNLGLSEGEPRNLVDPGRHNQDWRAAIAHVQGLGEVDGSRLALWGSSYSGGHVIVQAAGRDDIAAVVSQVAHADGRALLTWHKPGYILRATLHGLRDYLRLITGRAPHYVKIIGNPDEFACMNTPESMPGYSSIIPKDSKWQNGCPARATLKTTMYRPIAYARRVKCPALVILGEKDSICPPHTQAALGQKMPHARLERLPIGHFEPYGGEWFERIVKLQADFLAEHLL